ncbi:uncharacterized protein [Diadema antillarum]|uniref:uncharacterized protein isoform X2 n=1 Tax=Diadema antillarum TaxID=105358 RepID=UPI003A8C6B04
MKTSSAISISFLFGCLRTLIGAGVTVNYDTNPDAIAHFEGKYVLNPHKATVYICCRQVKFLVKGRMHSLDQLWVYDGVATDVETQKKLLIKHYYHVGTINDALRLAMIDYLTSLGILADIPCTIPTYSYPLLSSCAPGDSISCDQTCSFSCRTLGFQLVGSAQVQCCNNGSFIPTVPSCQANSCVVSTSSITEHLIVKKGNCAAGQRVEVDIGCEFSCDVGYRLSGSAVSTCGRDGTFSPPFPTCMVDSCLVNPSWITDHLVVRTENCLAGSRVVIDAQCEFSCDVGFRLSGSNMSTCGSDGSFSSPFPTCIVDSCLVSPSWITDHLVVARGKCLANHRVDIETKCEFACEEGYHLLGSDSSTCGSDGRFSSPFPKCASASTPNSHVTSCASLKHVTDVTTTDSNAVSHRTDKNDGVHSNQRGKSWLPYLAFLSLVFLVIPLAIYIRKRSCVPTDYQPLDNSQECALSNISPDVDGYYKHEHVTPATPTREQLDPSECYCMSLRNKGIVFVLNNNDYVDRGVRKGSEIDVINVTHVFNEIGYTPVVKQNLTAQEIRGALAEVKRTIRKIHTSVVLVFMSHGVQEGIYGSDGVVISVEDIKEMFSGKNCPSLIGKPKIFFFQACRGNKLTTSATDDRPLSVVSTSHDVENAAGILNALVKETEGIDPARDSELRTLSTGSTATDRLAARGELQTLSTGSAATDRLPALETDGVPDNADMYIAHATSEGYFAIRDRVNGSWFIQALCEELITGAHLYDLDTIMTKVAKRVKKLKGEIEYKGYKHVTYQTPQAIKQGIEKKIYFLPKYPPLRRHMPAERNNNAPRRQTSQTRLI